MSTRCGRPSDDGRTGVGVFVHPAGLCESDDVGEGTRIWAFAHVLAGARVGSDCNICDGAFVEAGAVLGDRVTVKNGTLVFAGVTCEDDVSSGRTYCSPTIFGPGRKSARSGRAR